MKVRLVKKYKEHKKGDVIDVSEFLAFALTKKGVAIIERMMTEDSYETVKHNG